MSHNNYDKTIIMGFMHIVHLVVASDYIHVQVHENEKIDVTIIMVQNKIIASLSSQLELAGLLTWSMLYFTSSCMAKAEANKNKFPVTSLPRHVRKFCI